MNTIIVLMLLILNIPIYKLIFGFIFSSKDDFYESIRYVFTPDIISLFKGEYGRDYVGELKFSLLIALCGVTVFIEYSFIQLVIRNFIG